MGGLTSGIDCVRATINDSISERAHLKEKDLAALHRRGQWHDDRLVMIRRPLIPGLVWPVPVMVPRVLGQHYPQVGSIPDQHPVGALRP
jgi:hypothetical protein